MITKNAREKRKIVAFTDIFLRPVIEVKYSIFPRNGTLRG